MICVVFQNLQAGRKRKASNPTPLLELEGAGSYEILCEVRDHSFKLCLICNIPPPLKTTTDLVFHPHYYFLNFWGL